MSDKTTTTTTTVTDKGTSTLPPVPEGAVMEPPAVTRATSCPISGCDPSKCTKEECNENVKAPTEGDRPFTAPPSGQINLLDLEIDGPNTALNVMVGFLGLAQKRGAFAINESAKIFECINKFS